MTRKKINLAKVLASINTTCPKCSYETGQATPSHHHPAEDELFVILEGHATVLAGDHQLDAPAGSLVIVPANVPMTSETRAADDC